MKVVYKKWNADKGLEDIQAKIYTEASGLPAQDWQIRNRNIHRGTDATRYALTEDEKPLAYVTSSISNSEQGRASISYPWAMPDCPPEVQMTLFNEQFEYLKNKEDIDTITTGVLLRSKIKDKQIEFFKKSGFSEYETRVHYNADFDVEETARMKLQGKAAELNARPATENDIDILVDLCMTDEHMRQAFFDKEELVSYLKERVFPMRPPTILFDREEAVAATAPIVTDSSNVNTSFDGQRIILRFRALKPGHEYAWERLLVELAKDCNAAGWADIPIIASFGFRIDGPEARAIVHMKPEFREFETCYIYRKEK